MDRGLLAMGGVTQPEPSKPARVCPKAGAAMPT